MNYRIAMLVMGMVAFLGVGVAVTPGAAQAATVGTFSFYLQQSPSPNNCLHANGVGNQLTADYSGSSICSNITITTDGKLGSSTVYQFKDGNGNCIRANNSNVVKVENGACNTSDTGEQWIATYGTVGSGNTVRFENVLQQGWLKTDSYASGADIWVGNGGENNWLLV